MTILGSQLSHARQVHAKVRVTRTLGVGVQYKCAKNTWKGSEVSANSV